MLRQILGVVFLQEADITKVDEIEKAVEGTVAWLKETGSALAGVDLQHQAHNRRNPVGPVPGRQ